MSLSRRGFIKSVGLAAVAGAGIKLSPAQQKSEDLGGLVKYQKEYKMEYLATLHSWRVRVGQNLFEYAVLIEDDMIEDRPDVWKKYQHEAYKALERSVRLHA